MAVTPQPRSLPTIVHPTITSLDHTPPKDHGLIADMCTASLTVVTCVPILTHQEQHRIKTGKLSK